MSEENNIPEGAPEGCEGSCSSCGVSGCGAREHAEPQKYQPNGRSDVKKVIAVVSGKGGVGKSLVTSLIAAELAKSGKKVGILDADVTGPSIPKAFGATEQPIPDADGINPIETSEGIKMISVNLLLPEGDTPVAWRGPVITNILHQFFCEVNWGDLDVLLIDMPPGTSDVFLTIFQMFPVDGIVTVSAPQELVGMIVGKAVNLAHSLKVPVIGLVENMAYFKCDECGKEHHIFGKPQGAEIAKKYEIEAVSTLPMDPEFAAKVDAGKVSEYDTDGALSPIIEAIEKA
ncbi:MAG: Mrp/NBP35 family ATP-binding protein [Eggerthellaceae bacterium]|nr:Mrp/NBP35 family ATP-binding protein [Eggerthellaceae bacterium]